MIWLDFLFRWNAGLIGKIVAHGYIWPLVLSYYATYDDPNDTCRLLALAKKQEVEFAEIVSVTP